MLQELELKEGRPECFQIKYTRDKKFTWYQTLWTTFKRVLLIHRIQTYSMVH